MVLNLQAGVGRPCCQLLEVWGTNHVFYGPPVWRSTKLNPSTSIIYIPNGSIFLLLAFFTGDLNEMPCVLVKALLVNALQRSSKRFHLLAPVALFHFTLNEGA